jgi:hypothetical protein
MNFISEAEYREKLAASEREIKERGVDIQELTTALQIVRQDNARLRESMAEAWKLVNAMAGQEYWQRAEDWIAENRHFAPEGIILSNLASEGQPGK